MASRFLTTANPAASSASSVGTQINHAEVAQSLITNMLPPKVKRLIKVQTHPLDAVAVESKLPWELRVAALIERIPSITPDLHPIEIAYQMVQATVRQGQMKQYPEAFFQAEGFVEDGKAEDSDLAPSKQRKAKKGTLEAFEPAPRVTEADHKGDVRTTRRRLEDRLYLLVKTSAGWELPQVVFKSEAGLREAAIGLVKQHVGPQLDLHWLGYAPSVALKVQYPQDLQKSSNAFGAKVFCFRTQYLGGNLALDKALYSDYAWLARDEIEQYLPREVTEGLLPVLPSWHQPVVVGPELGSSE